jgi:hypothetical protein
MIEPFTDRFRPFSSLLTGTLLAMQIVVMTDELASDDSSVSPARQIKARGVKPST